MSKQSMKKTVVATKKPAPVIYKSFRLIDFIVYDKRPVADSSETESETASSVGGERGGERGGGAPEKPAFVIQMFGLNEKGETCSILVDDYKPFFFVKVCDEWNDDTDTPNFLRFIERMTGKKNIRLSGHLVEHKKLYGFDGGKKHKFVKIIFDTAQHMNAVKNLWYDTIPSSSPRRERRLKKVNFRVGGGSGSTGAQKTVQIELYEGAIPPLLRYFHIENISPSGWVKVPLKSLVSRGPGVGFLRNSGSGSGSDSDTSSRASSRASSSASSGSGGGATTSCNYEFVCSRAQIKPIADKETRVPYKICSFDIEASSSHGDFPVPKKTYKRLAMNIVDVLLAAGCIGADQAAILIKKGILTAFGHDNMEDIDVVYPKNKPSERILRALIDQLLKYGVDSAAGGGAGEKNRLEDMFVRMQSQSYFAGGGAGAGGDDDDAAAADDGDAAPENNVFEIRDSEDDDEITTVPAKKRTVRIEVPVTSPPVSQAPPKKCIADVLTKSDLARDEKIILLNTLLTEKVDFPELEGDKVTFIGSTFMKYGENEPYMNHCFVLGSCDPVDGAIIEAVDTEYDLLMQWKDLIVRENPDIIIGYNIFGFDYEFLFRRAEENHCATDFLEMTRRVGEKSGKVNFRTGSIEDIEHTSVVLASGEYDLKYFKMTGRLQIDMYTYMRRDFNLPSYKLDDIAGQFIGDDIKKITYSMGASDDAPVTELHTNNITGLHVNDFIHIEVTGFTTDYYGEKHRILEILSNEGDSAATAKTRLIIAGHHEIDTKKSIRWGLAKDDVSPQDIFRLANEGAASRAIVAKYCIQDCNLVHHLLNKIDVITGYIEMSRICSVPISFLVFRGQGIKLTSYVAKKCRERDTLMPDLARGYGDDGYEGAIVLPPKCSMYFDNPVACVDYASLYPSSMISENLSHDSKVWTKEYDRDGKLIKVTGERDANSGEFIYDNLPGYEYVDIEFDTYKYLRPTPTARAVKTKYGKMICRWAQFAGGQKAIMPSILEELLRARSDTRKLAKTVTDPFMQNILDKRQLGYKVTANSLYGQCGAQTSTFYEKDIAASTTATGRKMITYARRIIEEVYGSPSPAPAPAPAGGGGGNSHGREYETAQHGTVYTNAEYVYGDTDSVFFTFNLKDHTGADIRGKRALEITIEIAQDVAHMCTKFLKAPMELAYEKTLMPFILLSKKRYVGMLYETNPNKGKLKYMGLSLKRRDSCDYLKDTYGNIIKMLMAGESISTAEKYLNETMTDLVEGRVPIEKLMLTRSLRSDYKNPGQIAHKVLADRIGKRDPGNKPKSGDRLKFAYIVNPNPRALLGERIETPEFIAENNLKIDYNYYITNQLMKPLQQLFGLAIEQMYIERGRGDTSLRAYRRELAKLQREFPDMEVYMKKKEVYCSKEVKKLVFDWMITRIQNERAGNTEITSFFAAPAGGGGGGGSAIKKLIRAASAAAAK